MILGLFIGAASVHADWPPWGDDFWYWLTHGFKNKPVAEEPVTPPCDKEDRDPVPPPVATNAPPPTNAPPSDGTAPYYVSPLVGLNLRAAPTTEGNTPLARIPQGWSLGVNTNLATNVTVDTGTYTFAPVKCLLQDWWPARLRYGTSVTMPGINPATGYVAVASGADRYVVTADEVLSFLIKNTPSAGDGALVGSVPDVPTAKWSTLPITGVGAVHSFGFDSLITLGCDAPGVDLLGGALSPGLAFEVAQGTQVKWPGGSGAMIVPVPPDILAVVKPETETACLAIAWQGFIVLAYPLHAMATNAVALQAGDLLGLAGGAGAAVGSKVQVQWVVASPAPVSIATDAGSKSGRVLVNPLFFFSPMQASGLAGRAAGSAAPCSPYQLGWYVNQTLCTIDKPPPAAACTELETLVGTHANSGADFDYRAARQTDLQEPWEDPLDDVEIAAGTSFLKYWIVQNTGKKTWTAAEGVKLKLISAKDSSGVDVPNPQCTAEVELQATEQIAQKQLRKFCVNITAPTNHGTYKYTYKLVRGSGETPFGSSDGLYSRFKVVRELPVVQFFQSPIDGVGTGELCTDTYGYDYLQLADTKYHAGVDKSGAAGTYVRAVGPGEILVRKNNVAGGCEGCSGDGYNSGWGNYVVMRHRLRDNSSVYTLYGHLQQTTENETVVTIEEGDIVDGGTAIGYRGSTGNSSGEHLHFNLNRVSSANVKHGYVSSCAKAKEEGFVNPVTFFWAYNAGLPIPDDVWQKCGDPCAIPAPYSATYVSNTPEDNSTVNQGSVTVTFTMKNSGSNAWPANTLRIRPDAADGGYPGFGIEANPPLNSTAVAANNNYSFSMTIDFKGYKNTYVNIPMRLVTTDGTVICDDMWLVFYVGTY